MVARRMIGKKKSEAITGKELRTYFIFWVLYLIFFTFQRYYAYYTAPDKETLFTSFLLNLIYLPDAVIFTHFIVNYVNPKYFFRNRFREFYLIFISTVILYPIVPFLIRTQFVNNFIKLNAETYDLSNYFATILIYVFSITILSLRKVTQHLKEEAVLHQKLDNDRLRALLRLKETELKLLKSQLHPHFLFNTLNNLYSLALEKSDKTSDLIIRLGDMLSYIIYDCNSDKVPLSKEVDFLNSFIELQRVRFNSCEITFQISGEIDNQVIAPMLLHTFIDNSFKHGASRITGNSWINISLNAINGFIEFKVINNKPAEKVGNKEAVGIGIENAKRRLELLYRDRYELKIDDAANSYSVFLKIQL